MITKVTHVPAAQSRHGGMSWLRRLKIKEGTPLHTMPTDPLIEQHTCRHPGWKKTVAVALVLTFLQLTVIPPGWAQQQDEDATESTASQFGLGVSSFFLTIPYGAVKFVYATMGGIIGGFTYALTGGNEGAAKAVWDTSLRGTYVITPDHLKGDRAVRFLGVPGESEGSATSTEPVPSMPEPAKK
ncbi:MAG: hypothetical protein ACREIK_04365 [Nitrospiraceae bacterium]